MDTDSSGNRGFTLIELMIVIAIVAVLVSLALPAYQNYSIRSKAAEGLSVGAGAKLAIEEFCQSDASINVTTQTGYSFEQSKYVSNVRLIGK
jgi:type IV pilus assembly protein PilA